MQVKDFSKIYFALLTLQIVVIYQPQSQVLFILGKVLLVFSLFAFFYNGASDLANKIWITTGLLFIWISELLTVFENDISQQLHWASIILGLLSFIGFHLKSKPHQSLKQLGLLAFLIASIGLTTPWVYSNVYIDMVSTLCFGASLFFICKEILELSQND